MVDQQTNSTHAVIQMIPNMADRLRSLALGMTGTAELWRMVDNRNAKGWNLRILDDSKGWRDGLMNLSKINHWLRSALGNGRIRTSFQQSGSCPRKTFDLREIQRPFAGSGWLVRGFVWFTS